MEIGDAAASNQRHNIPAWGIISTTSVFGILSRCELKSGSRDKFDRLVTQFETARKEPGGLIAYSCPPVSGLAESLVVFELYADHLAFIQFGQRQDIRGLIETRDALLAEPRRVEFLEDPIGGSLLYFGHR